MTAGSDHTPLGPGRRFTIRDVCIIVAAAGVTVWLNRLSREVNRSLFSGPDAVWWRSIFDVYLALFVSSVTVFILRLLPPRPPFGRLMRQPGFVAGLAVIANAIVQTLDNLASLLPYLSPSTRSPAMTADRWILSELRGLSFPWNIGPFIALAWLVQGLGGYRRPERSWLDRIGRGLGGSGFSST
jgi:hypothetical protein